MSRKHSFAGRAQRTHRGWCLEGRRRWELEHAKGAAGPEWSRQQTRPSPTRAFIAERVTRTELAL